jgi:hypothetical protein
MKHLLLSCLLALAITSASWAQSPPESTADSDRVLSKFASSLVGKWYTSGDLNKPSYIAATGSMLFTINETKDTLELYANDNGTLIARRSDYETSGVVVSGNYILWTNGCWWSRAPVTLSPKAP